MNKKILLIIVLVIIGAVIWIFLKPVFTNVGNNGKTGTTDYKELTTDEKLEILEGLTTPEDAKNMPTTEEKLKILEGLSSQNSEANNSSDTGSQGSEMTTEEKLKILEGLSSQ